MSPRELFAERFVLTVRTELTDRMLIFGSNISAGCLPGMPRTTTRGDRIEHCNCVRHVPKCLFPDQSMARSGVDRFSVA